MTTSMATQQEASFFERLNPAQRLAVEHGVGDPDGDNAPLLVIAGAGSGKTNTLAHRVAWLIRSGVDPRTILLLTFARRAAQEMTRRVDSIVARLGGQHAALSQAGFLWSGTFHGIGARLLREYARQIGLDPAFTIHDREDSADLLNLVRTDHGLHETGKRFPQKHTCLSIYSRVVNTQQSLAEVLADAFPWCCAFEPELRKLFGGYVEAKQKQNVLDYDDLLLGWATMLEDAGLAAEVGRRFSHVLVDEYQDTNRLQAAIVKALKPDGRGVTVVGDDAQAIYAFRGASVRNILDFPQQYEPPARVVTLDRNYRSTPTILSASNAVMRRAAERFTKDLWTDRKSDERPVILNVPDEADQARYVAEQVLERREAGLTLKSQAVLFRASHHSAQLELELARRNIPFVKFGGLRFLEAAHVKDVVTLLRWADNPRDRIAGLRTLQLLPGVGPKTATRALDAVASAEDPALALARQGVATALRGDWDQLAGLFAQLRSRPAAWPSELAAVHRWYQPHLERRHDNADVRWADLMQLESLAAGYPSREQFLTDLTLGPPDATSDQAGVPLLDEDYLILSTIHSAKGQEWRAVYLLNAVDGCIPSDLATGSTAELEEERRLLYVAMTRAKDHLTVVVPQRFYVNGQGRGGDRHVYASRTRFIPDALAPHFEARTWPVSTVAGGAEQGRPFNIDIAARMRQAWS
jgi:DNA helicase II / ATP-dependent DNA helicase PcrA